MLRFGYNELARSAISRALPRYHFRPKLHLLEHAVLDWKPKTHGFFSNYLGEDAIRRIKSLASKAPARNMSQNVGVCSESSWLWAVAAWLAQESVRHKLESRPPVEGGTCPQCGIVYPPGVLLHSGLHGGGSRLCAGSPIAW